LSSRHKQQAFLNLENAFLHKHTHKNPRNVRGFDNTLCADNRTAQSNHNSWQAQTSVKLLLPLQRRQRLPTATSKREDKRGKEETERGRDEKFLGFVFSKSQGGFKTSQINKLQRQT